MGYIGHSPTNAGTFYILDDITLGSGTTYTMQVGGVDVTPSADNLLITLDGVIQHAGDAYTVSGSNIVFASGPGSGVEFYGIIMGQSATVGQGSIGADELKVSGDGTNGQVLTSDGDGTFSWATDTEAYVPLAGGTMTGTLAMGSNDITGTGDIGGTLTTAAQGNITSVGTLSSLTLGGDLTIPQKIVHSGDTDTYLSFGTDSLSLYTGGTNVVDFIYGNIYIKGNNKALTGYTTGGGAKELIKIDGSDIVQIGEGQDVSITGDGARFYVKSADEELISIGRAGSSGASLDQGYIRMKSGGSNKVAFHTAGSSYINGGSLGINEDTPVAKLDVRGASSTISLNTDATAVFTLDPPDVANGTYLFGDGSSGTDQVQILAVNDSAANENEYAGIGFGLKYSGNIVATLAGIAGIKENDTDGSGGDVGALAFGTRATGDYIKERMRISSAGNVTIGAGNDTKELGVNRAKIRHLEGLADNANWTGAELYINHINNGNIYMSGTGSVGIGTSSINSNAKLHIRGASSGQTSSSNNTQLTVESSGTAGIQLLTGTTSVGGFWIGDSNGAETGGKLYYSNNTDFWQFYNSGSTDTLNISTDMFRLYNADTGSAGSTLKQLSMGWSTSTYWDTTNTGTFVGMSIANAHNDAGVGCGIQFVTRSSSSGISYIVSRSEGSDSSSLHFGTRGTDGVARRMLIGADGSVNISANSNNKASINIVGTGTGQAPNDAKVYVSKNSANDWSFIGTGGGDNYGMKLNGAGSYALFITDHSQSGDVRSRISFDGYVYSTDGSIHDIDSDKRKKEDIDSAESQWQMLKDLPLQKFKWKDKRAGDKYSYGWIAQDVQKKYPELVNIVPQTKEDIENEVEDPEYLTVRTGDIHRLAIKALQEAMDKIETLETKVEALENA
jgi:hypothetical protein